MRAMAAASRSAARNSFSDDQRPSSAISGAVQCLIRGTAGWRFGCGPTSRRFRHGPRAVEGPFDKPLTTLNRPTDIVVFTALPKEFQRQIWPTNR